MEGHLGDLQKCFTDIRTAYESLCNTIKAVSVEKDKPKRQKIEKSTSSSPQAVDFNNNNACTFPSRSEEKNSVEVEELKRKLPSKQDDGNTYKISPDPAQTVTASFHQKSSRRGLSKLRGSQCTSMALTAVMISKQLPVKKWRAKDLDAILRYGDRLHVDLISKVSRNTTDPRLALHEIPSGSDFTYTIPIPNQGDKWFDRDYPRTQALTLSKSDEYYGQVNKARQSSSTQSAELGDTAMDQALEKVFGEDYDGAVITVGDVSGAVMKDTDGRIRYFDSHCNNKIGRLTLEGTAVLLTFDSAQEFSRYVRKRESNPYCRYELIGIRQNQV